ncbi:hypothetical protein SISNIDRAFT_450424 [Sistotremastrum niveocremeum HHB9708]|uniref:Uncharacterized protein n=1 Tax=Sistotremastrum niveocremeum HHB9708 TaxID=1314777 RepID=A0A164Y933_9AGAM|nr:hypothetical protein SISNIDRAFT_450424 [Sistotremastrum niveocremeum HHB9708]
MRWSPFVITSALSFFVSGSLSIPAPSNGTSHTLMKRSVVCGQNVRTAVAEDCLEHRPSLFFALGGTVQRPLITAHQLDPTAQDIPPGAACDHVVELQVLARAMSSSGACAVITALNNLNNPRHILLQPLADVINGAGNLVFLDSRVNSKKASFVVNAMNGARITTADPLNLAVSGYLRNQLISTGSNAVAQHLDTLINQITAIAKTTADAIPALPQGVRAQGIQIQQQALKTAVAQLRQLNDRTPVISRWRRVLGANVVNE